MVVNSCLQGQIIIKNTETQDDLFHYNFFLIIHVMFIGVFSMIYQNYQYCV